MSSVVFVAGTTSLPPPSSSMASRAALWRTLTAVQVYGANTDVGKTVVTTVLCNAARQANAKVAFLKPVSTGPQHDADDG